MNNIEDEKKQLENFIYCYKYYWKNKNGRLCVKYITDINAKHVEFMDALVKSDEVLSAMREYQFEIDPMCIGFNETIKKEKEA